MEVDIRILEYLLGSRYEIIRNCRKHPAGKVSGIRLYEPGQGAAKPDPAYPVLYVSCGYAEDRVLCITDSREQTAGEGWYLLCQKGRIRNALSDVFGCFSDYCEWYQQTIVECELTRDFAAAAMHHERLTGCEMHILDSSWRILYSSRGFGSIWSEFSDSDMSDSSADVIQDLYDADPAFDRSTMEKGLQFLERFHIRGRRLYGYNLFDGEDYAGRVIFAAEDRCANEGMELVMEHFAREMELCISALRRASAGSESKSILRTGLSRALEDGTGIRQSDMRAVWGGSGPGRVFQMLCLRPAGYMQSDLTLGYMASTVESLIPDCVAVAFRGDIICLIWKGTGKVFTYHRSLTSFIRDHLFKAGISQPFDALSDVLKYYDQASDALRLGQKTDPSYWRFDFADYTGAYALSECTSKYTKEDLCPASVRNLMEYDEKHPGLDLVDTLHAFIRAKCNGSQAADLLHIHRTTFFYRLKKIHEVTSINFDSWDTVFSLMLYFSL